MNFPVVDLGLEEVVVTEIKYVFSVWMAAKENLSFH